METLLAALAAQPDSVCPPAVKRKSLRHVAPAIPAQPVEVVPKLLALALQWVFAADTTGAGAAGGAASGGSSMRRCGLILLRSLAQHPRMELQLPPTLAPQLTRSFGARAVPVLAALSPVLVRTPAQALDQSA